MGALTVIALGILGHALISERLKSTIVTAPMVFVALGLLTGPEALDLLSLIHI